VSKNTRRPDVVLEAAPESAVEIVAELNLRHPERSRTLINGSDIGSIQSEMRFGKQSGNELVFRVPLDRVTVRFVRR
jgi:hypothetical protein